MSTVAPPRRRSAVTVTASRAALAALAAVAILLLGSSAASAHDRLVSSSPADGATLATTPTKVVLTFSDEVVPVGTQLVVSGPDGEVQQGRPRVDGATVTQAIAPGSPAGRYTVTWRVTSKDGHPVSGTLAFTAQAAGTPVPSRTTSAPAPSSATTSTGASSATRAGTATDGAAPTSGTSTGGSDQTGTSWVLWLALAVVVLAGAGATAIRLRRGHADRGHG